MNEMIQEFRNARQHDADGVMVVVSRQAVEEAISSIVSMRATLRGIAEAKPSEWEGGLNRAIDFVRWAQSRARYALGDDWPEKPPHDAPCECASVGSDYCPRHAL